MNRFCVIKAALNEIFRDGSHTKAIVLILLECTVRVILFIIQALLISNMVAAAINGDIHQLTILLVSFLILIAIVSIIGPFTGYKIQSAFINASRVYENSLINRFIKMRYPDYMGAGYTELVSLINHDLKSVVNLLSSLSSILFVFAFGSISLIIILVQSPIIAIFILGTNTCQLLLTNFISKTLHETSSKIAADHREYTSILEEVVDKHYTFNVLNLTKYIDYKIDKYAFGFLGNSKKKAKAYSFQQSAEEFFAFLSNVALIFIGAILIFQAKLKVQELAMIVQLQTGVVGLFRSFSLIMMQIDQTRPSINNLKKIQSIAEEDVDLQTELLLNESAELSIEKLTFFYDKENQPLLLDFSATFRTKTINILSSSSGSGKSTILRIFLHFYSQYKGCIKFNENDIASFTLKGVRSIFSYQSQDSTFIQDSILENIRMHASDITFEEVKDLCKRLNLDSVIEDLPNGYNSIVGRNTINLSSGQAQRICFARAYIRKSPILLLDEPTSKQDECNSSNMMELLHEIKHKRIVILVTHDVSIINSKGVTIRDLQLQQ